MLSAPTLPSDIVGAALARFLRRLRLNSILSDEEQQAILALPGEVREVAANRDLVLPGRLVGHAILVAEGLLGRFDQMSNGARQITALHIAGDMCDLHSVVSPDPGWGITAIANATIVTIGHEAIRSLALTRPNIALAFWRDTTLDASLLAKGIANIGRKDARARVAHLLCEMGVRMERAGLGSAAAYELPITQGQIGDLLGLTAVHVNRTLSALRATGLAAKKGRAIRIDDWPALAAVAEFDPVYILRGEATADR